MKKRKKALSSRNFANDFVRGTLVSSIISAVAHNDGSRWNRADLRRALQGGAVLAAATVAADALQQGSYVKAALAVTGAAVSACALQGLLPDRPVSLSAVQHTQPSEGVSL